MSKVPKVAVVDDDPSVRRALVRLIRSAGFQAEGYGSAEQFLARTSGRPACLVLDVRLPGMSGIDLQRRLCEERTGPPVVFISADGTPESRDKALMAGAVDFLHKPFDEGALLTAIGRALNGAPRSGDGNRPTAR